MRTLTAVLPEADSSRVTWIVAGASQSTGCHVILIRSPGLTTRISPLADALLAARHLVGTPSVNSRGPPNSDSPAPYAPPSRLGISGTLRWTDTWNPEAVSPSLRIPLSCS